MSQAVLQKYLDQTASDNVRYTNRCMSLMMVSVGQSFSLHFKSLSYIHLYLLTMEAVAMQVEGASQNQGRDYKFCVGL